MQYGEGFVVFCDEIRHENNNKDIYIGVYSAEYNITAPIASFKASRFSIVATTLLNPKDPPEKTKRIEVFFPGEDVPRAKLDITIPPDVLEEGMENDELSRFDETPITVKALFGLSDIRFKQAGFVRVIMVYGEEQFLLGRLEINFRTPHEDADSSAPMKAGGHPA